MPAPISDSRPSTVTDDLHRLCTGLDDVVPAKRLDRNLLVATWNIRAFGDLTEKWCAEESDRPKRDMHALLCIAEIVSRFDVVALQEVKDNIKALRHMMKKLGPDWAFILTDATMGSRGNEERMAFVFDTRRVRPSGLAGELVVPEEWIGRASIDKSTLTRQFARTPFAVSFVSGGETFILVTLHVIYGKGPEERTSELCGIAEWLADWAKREQSWGHNLIALGDFNIDRKEDENYMAFTSTGLRPPAELDCVPRTIFRPRGEKRYDQIAWFSEKGAAPVLSLTYSGKAGCFDFTPLVLQSLSRNALSWRISDHYPLWVEFLAGSE